MADPVVIQRPNATIQSGTWTTVGAANPHTALSDNSDSSYVQLTPRCRQDPDVLKLGIPAPSLAAGAKIYSVGVRIRVQTIVPPAPPPICLWHHHCRHSLLDLILGILFFIFRLLFCHWRCPPKPTVVWVEQSLGVSTTNPAGTEWTLADFDDYQVHLERDDANGNPLRISEVYVDIDYNLPPTSTATGPTGTNTANCRPVATWSYSDSENDPQGQFQARVFSSAQYTAVGFDPGTSLATVESGWTSGTDLSWQIPLDLVNGNWRVYVQVKQQWPGLSDSISAWTFTSWTQNVAGAPGPVMLDAIFEQDLNRIKLQVNPSGPSPATVSYTIFASRDAGITWNPVRGGIQLPGAGTPVASVTAVGTAAFASGTGTTTLAVNPTAVGDLLVLGTRLDTTSNAVASVSGGGVTEWIHVIQPFAGSSKTFDLWMGVVTASGSSTITITGNSSLAAVGVSMFAQQFHSSAGSGTSWSIDATGTGRTNGSSTSVTFPTVVPSGSGGRAYIGLGWTTNTAQTTGATSGYTVQVAGTNNMFVYNPNVSTSQSPVATQNTAGASTTIGFVVNAATANPVTLYDYEAPLNQVSQYRAVAFRQQGSLRFVSASYSNIVSATPVISQFWLKDPLDPTLNSPFPIAYLGDAVTRQKAQGIFSVIAGTQETFKVAVNGPQYGLEGTFNLIFKDTDPQDYWQNFKALDATGHTLLLQYPNGEQHYMVFGPGTTGSDMQWIWDLNANRTQARYYKVQVSYIEVAPVPIS